MKALARSRTGIGNWEDMLAATVPPPEPRVSLSLSPLLLKLLATEDLYL